MTLTKGNGIKGTAFSPARDRSGPRSSRDLDGSAIPAIRGGDRHVVENLIPG